jgi:hypothetical protein
MIKLILLLAMTAIGLIVAVILFLGLAWLVIAIPTILVLGGGAGALAWRRRLLTRRLARETV